MNILERSVCVRVSVSFSIDVSVPVNVPKTLDRAVVVRISVVAAVVVSCRVVVKGAREVVSVYAGSDVVMLLMIEKVSVKKYVVGTTLVKTTVLGARV